ncbi:hypothetical protein [Pueribacillus sp. YX66]|uniref:hypothetical protein n=1 Tax=Pueribacillus sp. YX66 TaxID=3229242 RepID=UPI00358D77C3
MTPKYREGDILVHKHNSVIGKITVIASDDKYYIVESHGEVYRFSHKHLEHEWDKKEG